MLFGQKKIAFCPHNIFKTIKKATVTQVKKH